LNGKRRKRRGFGAAETWPDGKERREEERTMPLPKSYRTIEDFQREELRPQYKAGFSLDDLMQETMLHESDLLFDDQIDEYEPDDDDDDE
jgi:hypothetical protein